MITNAFALPVHYKKPTQIMKMPPITPSPLPSFQGTHDLDSTNGAYGPVQSQLRRNPPLEANFHSNRSQIKSESSPFKIRANSLMSARKNLPIAAHESQIRQGLRENDVMLLVGETGSGKSTQIPQFLVTEEWCRARSAPTLIHKMGKAEPIRSMVGGRIAITEPRRVAAITLARRVAEEMSTTLGSSSPASKVGYSVRFDSSISPSTQIKFLTEGMLLQELLRDPWLKEYSAVVVDEVHERGVNVDLILGFLWQMITAKFEGRGGIPLKVVVMSATADMERLQRYFTQAYARQELSSDGSNLLKTDDTMEIDLSDNDTEWSGISSSDKDEENVTTQTSQTTKKRTTKSGQKIDLKADKDLLMRDGIPQNIAICHIKGRQHPVTIKFAPEPLQYVVDAALELVFQINYKEPMPGDVLVFLPGQETVESLESLVNQHAQDLKRDIPKLLALPLFAALPVEAQQQVFDRAPPRTRKVIIATNIAETSITVPGVRHVIDCGTAKVKQFRSSLGLDALLVKGISKSAATQRAGRAGREGPGQCYRLYTESAYLELQASNTPEILRCDLTLPILTMKARGVEVVTEFPFLDQPPVEAFLKACQKLYQLGALKNERELTDIGLQMAKLPLPVSLGRVLIAAAESEFNCTAEIIDIISCLSVDNIFLNLASEDKKEQAEAARRGLYHRDGDHLTLLKTMQAYAAETSDRKAWAQRHFVSHRAMRQAMQVRKQLQQHCRIVLREGREPIELTTKLAMSILKCFLKGFPTNTARSFPDGSYRTIEQRETVAIHPSSVLFGKKAEAIVYNEYVFTNKSYARGVSAVSMEWILEAVEQGPSVGDEGPQT